MLKNLYLFFILHQIHCFLFQFDSSLFFIMQILINVWYVCVNKQWTVNIHLIFYRLLQQTILTSCSQFKATMDWLSLCQWLFKRKYHLLFSCTYFVLSQNPYTKQLFLDSVHSPYIEQKQQAVSHTFQHLFKKPALICGTNWLCVDSSHFISPIWSTVLIHYLSAFPIDEYDCLLRTVGHQ